MNDQIVIVGGGTSGWMSASYLKKSFPNKQIVVIESKEARRVGVGESTVPNLQSAFWDHLGIPEEVWMKRVNATYKLGIKFVNWSKQNGQDNSNSFYHPFGVLPSHNDVPMSHYWNYKRLKEDFKEPFGYSCFKEAYLADEMKSPRTLDGQKISHYAWHFDANLVTEYLKELSIDWGVKLYEEHVVSAETNSDGMITSISTKEGRTITGDLFIDCTGFSAILIEKVLKEPFIDMGDTLLCNAAVATQMDTNNEEDGIAPYTTSTALSAGWSWDIPLLGRKGAGYVFSDKFISMDEAIEEFSAFLGVDPEKQQWNRIRFKVGRRRRAWVKNCVAIGLASNFLEPLESSALYLTYGSLYQLTKYFPENGHSEELRDRFNEETSYSYDDYHGFVQMHYVTTKRNDSAFWRANQENLTLCDDYIQKLKKYEEGLVVNPVTKNSESYYNDFEYEYRNFWTDGSYYSILAGMNVFPDKVHPKLSEGIKNRKEVDKMFTNLEHESNALLERLPSHYEYLKKLHHSSKIQEVTSMKA